MSLKFTLAILLIISTIYAVFAWSFDEELKGQWSIEKLLFNGNEDPQTIALSLNITVDGENIRGVIFDSVLDEKSSLEIVKESQESGTFKIVQGVTGEELELDGSEDKLEFPLNFKNSELGIHVSNTYSTDDSIVDFVILNKNSWMLTKIGKNGKTEKWIAKRTDVPQAGFFSKYGPMTFMIGFFLLSNIFKQRMAQPQPQVPTPEAKNK